MPGRHIKGARTFKPETSTYITEVWNKNTSGNAWRDIDLELVLGLHKETVVKQVPLWNYKRVVRSK